MDDAGSQDAIGRQLPADPATIPPGPVAEAGLAGPTDAAAGGDPGLRVTLRWFADSTYQDAFWPERQYENACDRIALRAFLPPTGSRLLEAGAGFGRLADEYDGYGAVVLLDASEALLTAAAERVGDDPRFSLVRGDMFRLPFPDASFDAAVCIRVVHHFEDPRPAITELARVLRPGGVLVLESTCKRNIRAILAYLLRRQSWSPFARGTHRDDPVYLLPDWVRRRRRGSAGAAAQRPQRELWKGPATAFEHAPQDLRLWLRAAGFRIEGTRSVGVLRLPAVTRHVPLRLLTTLERVLQRVLAPITAGPSIIYRAVRVQRRTDR